MKFFDTNALILLQNKAFEEKFIISSITLNELEQIKTSKTKDEETKWAARHILHLLADNEDKYEIEIYKSHYEDDIKTLDLPISDDSKIIICAKESFIRRNCLDTGIFVTEDLACKKIAECIGLKTEYPIVNKDNYTTISCIIKASF
jgi:predicted PilT family ATPase